VPPVELATIEHVSTRQPLTLHEGTPLPLVDAEEVGPSSAGLAIWSALSIFFGYLVGQVAGGILVALVAGIAAGLQGSHLGDPQLGGLFNEAIVGPAAVVGVLVGAIVALNLTRYFYGGAADFYRGVGWSRGTWTQLAVGVAGGVLLGAGYLFIGVNFVPPRADTPIGPVTQLANSPGSARLYWAFLVLALAPPMEEFLFRGVLFTGFSRSWGMPAASLIVTLMFALVHVPETMHYWPALAAIALTGASALAIRLHTGSLGPAVALHAAYNLIIVLGLFVSTSG